jgi:hypothetical protein
MPLILALHFSFGVFGQGGLRISTVSDYDLGEGAISSLLAEDDDFYYLLLTDEDGLIHLSATRNFVILQFNHDLSHVKKIAINHQNGEEYAKLNPLAFHKTSHGFVLLCRKYSSINQKLESYLFLINENGDIEKILTPGEIEDISESDLDFDYFNLHRILNKSDSTFEYVFTTTTPYFLDLSEKINFIVYDENLEITGTHLLDYPNDLIDYKIEDVMCSQDGLFFIRVEISNPFKDGALVHQLVIYDMHHDEFNTLESNFENAMIKKSSINFLNDRILGFSGYFVEGPYQEKPTGIFYYLFDAASGNLLKQKIHYFSDNDLEMINPKNYHSKSDFDHLQPSGIHLTKHNHILLLFEYNWESMLLIRDQEGMMYNQPYYYANELVLFRFDSENQLSELKIFHKRQMSGLSSRALGFKGFISGDSFHFFYNDHPKNTNIFFADKLKTMKRNYVTMHGEYDLQTGEFSKSVFDSGDDQLLFNPSEMIFTISGNVLVLSQSVPPKIIRIKID